MTPAWIIFHLRVGPTKLALTRMVEPGTSTSVPLSWVRPDLQRPLKSHPRLGRRSGVLCRGDGLLTPPIWHRNWLNLVRLVGAVAIRNVFLWRPYEPAPHKLFRPGIVSPSATREGSTPTDWVVKERGHVNVWLRVLHLPSFCNDCRVFKITQLLLVAKCVDLDHKQHMSPTLLRGQVAPRRPSSFHGSAVRKTKAVSLLMPFHFEQKLRQQYAAHPSESFKN